MPIFSSKPIKKPLIALVLSGGGSRGFAHLGALKAFDEAGIRFDLVAGTSVGSIAGAFLCAGISVPTMMDIAGRIQAKQIHQGIVPNDPMRIGGVVKNYLGNMRFEDLKTPLYVVAVDLRTGKQVILDKGLLYEAVAASCAVPIFYRPFVMGELHLADGGLLNNIPADVARMMGAACVVTVDINAARGGGTDSLSLLPVAKAALSIMMTNSSESGLINSDIIIAPDLAKFRATKKDGSDEMIELGYEAAKVRIAEIKGLTEKRK